MTSLHTEHADEGQQHCCWESLRDYSFVKLKHQPSQTELLFRSVADCFFLWEMMGEMGGMGAMGSDGIAAYLTFFCYGRDGSQLEERENTEERVMRRACFGERR